MSDPDTDSPAIILPGTGGPRRLLPERTGRLLIIFYQEDATPSCTTQLCSFRDDFDLLKELDVEVVAVSADDLDAHRAFIERLGGLPFPLLSDTDGTAARTFGFWDPETRRSQRAVLILDRNGTILHVAAPYAPGKLAQYVAVFRALGLPT